jgi:hypothetical protein
VVIGATGIVRLIAEHIVLGVVAWWLTGVVCIRFADGDSVARVLSIWLTGRCETGIVFVLVADGRSVARVLAIDLVFILVADGDSVARVLVIVAGDTGMVRLIAEHVVLEASA